MKAKILLTAVVMACLTMTALRLRRAYLEFSEVEHHAIKIKITH